MSLTVQSSGRLLILSSITKLTPDHAGAVVVSGSHGGVYPAVLAAKAGLRGAIFSDAGIGLEAAGIAGVKLLDEVGLACVAADYMSARDGDDIYARGVASHVNAAAERLGCGVGELVSLCTARMLEGERCVQPLPGILEGRALLCETVPQIWGIDSNSLAAATDAGALIVSGSHGALLGGDPASAIKPDVRAAAFNDAGWVSIMPGSRGCRRSSDVELRLSP